MQKEGSRWWVTILLPPGTYSYKFVVDGRWCFDIEKPNFVDPFSGSANNTLTIEDWRSELSAERSKTRDKIAEEVNLKMTAQFEFKKHLLDEESARKIKELEALWVTKEAQLNSQITSLTQTKFDLEQAQKTTSVQLEEARKILNEKRAVIESEVRHKYDTFVNALHNEVVQVKFELDKERVLSLDYKRRYEIEREKNELGGQEKKGEAQKSESHVGGTALQNGEVQV